MYVERYGAGPQRWLGLHGWSGDHHTFAPLAPHLPSGTSLYAPDLPGCGLSPPPRCWRLAAILEEIVTLIQELAQPGLALIGNCSGALLALCCALQLEQAGAGQRLERLILIDPLAYWPWYFRVFAGETAGRYAFACSFGNPAGRWLINMALAGKRRRNTDLTEGFTAVPSEVARWYLKALREIPGPESFAAVATPVEMLYGEKTFAAVRRSVGLYRGIWPQADAHAVPGAGHLPLREAPAAVAGLVFREQTCKPG